MTVLEPSARLLLQLGVIAAAGGLLSRAGRRLYQPPVVCEIVAGLLLGPSLLGWLAPSVGGFLFPPGSLPALRAAAQLGLCLYMFCVGLEFKPELLASGWRASAAVSVAGIAAPLALGAALGARLRGVPGLFPAAITPVEAAMFGGASICVTAFPVLARIVAERGLSGTRLGALAMGAAAFDDAAAWTMLACLLAVLTGRPSLALLAAGGGAAYGLFLWAGARPAARALALRAGPAAAGPGGLVATLAALMGACALTEAIGLHAVFGAFTLGLAMPRGLFAERLMARVEPMTSALLLPAFFAYSGLSTRVGLLSGADLWLVLLLVCAVATLGKGAACAAAARLSGLPLPESAAVGALMNTRGLMELVLLDIAYDRGLITQTAFTIWVLMAVATTVAASPVYEWLKPRLGASWIGGSRRGLQAAAGPAAGGRSRPGWP